MLHTLFSWYVFQELALSWKKQNKCHLEDEHHDFQITAMNITDQNMEIQLAVS